MADVRSIPDGGEATASDGPSTIVATGAAFLLAVAVFAFVGLAALLWEVVFTLWARVFQPGHLVNFYFPAPVVLAVLVGLVVGLRSAGGAWSAIGVGLGVGIGAATLALLNIVWQVVGGSVFEALGVVVGPGGGVYAGRAITSDPFLRFAVRDLLIEPAGGAVLAALVAVAAAGYGRAGIAGTVGTDGDGEAGDDALRRGGKALGMSVLAYLGLAVAVGVPVLTLGSLFGGPTVSDPADLLLILERANPFLLATVLGLAAGVRARSSGLIAAIGVGLGIAVALGGIAVLDTLSRLLAGGGFRLLDIAVWNLVWPGVVGVTATLVAAVGGFYGG